MSVFEALALIIGTLVFGIYVIMNVARMVESMVHVITTGVENALPLSVEHRWMLLWNFYVSTVLTGAAFAAAMALALAQVPGNVADPRVRTLAYVVTLVWSIASVLWVLGGINGFVYMAHVLRKAR
jgi:hypothetical protein